MIVEEYYIENELLYYYYNTNTSILTCYIIMYIAMLVGRYSGIIHTLYLYYFIYHFSCLLLHVFTHIHPL